MKYEKISLTWRGDVVSQTGEAQYARAILKQLINHGAYIKIDHMPPNGPLADLDPFWHNYFESNKIKEPGLIKINHCDPTQATANLHRGPNILLCHWDTINFPVAWGQALVKGNFTELWTSNAHALTPLKQQNINMNTYVLSYPIEPGFANGPKADITNVTSSTYVFGFTGIYNNRSNPSDLVTCFCTLFTDKDDVALVLKCNSKNVDNPNERQQIVKLIKSIKSTINKPDHPTVILLQDVFTQNAMDSIIRRFDCYVSTARGNSLNITAAKVIANGACAIGPSVGAFTDYSMIVDNDTILQTNFTLEPVTQTPNSSPSDLWCRTDMYNTIAAMKQIYDSRNKRTTNGIKKIEDVYSPDAICDNLATKLQSLMPPIKVTTLK